MDTLHGDLLQEILTRLPIRSLIQCASVSRSWRHLTHSCCFTHIYNCRSMAAKPGLMLYSLISDVGRLIFRHEFLFIDRRHSPKPTSIPLQFSIPYSEEYHLMGSCNGLLCFIFRTDNLTRFVCNPFLRKIIMLPGREYPPDRPLSMALDFGFCPKTQSYKFLEVSKWRVKGGAVRVEMFVHRLGDDLWNRIDMDGDLIVKRSGSACYVNGALHWVREQSAASLTVFDLEHEVFEEMPGPVDDEIGCFSSRVIGNCLSIMNIFDDVLKVWIMKEYWVCWEKCFVINLMEVVDMNLEFEFLDYQEEDQEWMIAFSHHTFMTYNIQEKKFKRIMNIDNGWYDAVVHSETLVLTSE